MSEVVTVPSLTMTTSTVYEESLARNTYTDIDTDTDTDTDTDAASSMLTCLFQAFRLREQKL